MNGLIRTLLCLLLVLIAGSCRSDVSIEDLIEPSVAEPILRLKPDIVGLPSLSAAGRYLANASGRHSVVWDLETQRIVLRTSGMPADIEFSQGGRTLFGFNSSDYSLSLYRVGEWEQPWKVISLRDGSDSHGGGMGFCLEDQVIAAVNYVGDGPSWFSIYDLHSGNVIRRFGKHERPQIRMTVSPNGRRIASIYRQKTVEVFDPATGERLEHFDLSLIDQWMYGGIDDLAVRGDLLVTTRYGALQFWDLRTHRRLLTLALPFLSIPPIPEFSADGTLLYVLTHDYLAIFRVEGEEDVQILAVVRGPFEVGEIAASADNAYIALVPKRDPSSPPTTIELYRTEELMTKRPIQLIGNATGNLSESW